MDHLCELPNDAARRKALNALPPTLHATYERILQRVNKCSKEVQQLVQRSLRWLLCSKKQLTSLALCEAVSIESGDTTLDRSAVPDEEEILRRCSSLVRRSASGKSLELAHFTVKEFLTTGIDPLDKEYGLYYFCAETEDIEAAKVCLRYLNFEDFGSGNRDSMEFSYERWDKFAFRKYAVYYWADHARKHLTNAEVMPLTQQLLHPSKPLNFVSWTQDFLWGHHEYQHKVLEDAPGISLTDLMTMGPLHFAAFLGLNESCAWLVQNGCPVDQTSACGTPLECAFRRYSVFESYFNYSDLREETLSCSATVKLIINNGADVQKGCLRGPSYLKMALFMPDEDLCIELLRKGAMIDSISIEFFGNSAHHGYGIAASKILESLSEDQIRPEDRMTLLEAALRFEVLPPNLSLERLVYRSGDREAAHIDYLGPFLAAAEYGQLSVLKQIFHDHKLGLDATGHSDQRSALHLAASNDHLELVEFLHEHGADPDILDCKGRTPLHASVEKTGRYLCLQFLLDKNVNVHITDDYGLTVWHLAALKGNAHALSILQKFIPENQMCPRLKDNEGKTPLHYAAQSCSKETLIFLLNYNDKDAVHDKSLDGMTALHYGVEACSIDARRGHIQGFDALEALLEHGADPASEDLMGRTALVSLVEKWEKLFLRQKADNVIYYHVPDGFEDLFSKILGSTKNASFLANVCKDPHLLCLAIIFGEENLARKILQYSPPVDAIAYRILRLNPLQAACHYGEWNRPLFEELQGRSKIDLGAGGAIPGLLSLACEGVSPSVKQVVTDLLDLGSNPNDRSAEGKTAMMVAAKRGHVAVVKMLIDHGADVSSTDTNRWSVIHYACQSGNEELLYLLKGVITDWNARITAKVGDSWFYDATALHLAASLPGNALRFLLTNDLVTDVNTLTQDKETALWMAAFVGMSGNVSLLLENAADDTIRSCYSEGPVHVAIRCRHQEVVTTFMDKGCDLNLQDGSGFTPQLIARKYGYLDLANRLKEKSSAGGMNAPICLDVTSPQLTSTRHGWM